MSPHGVISLVVVPDQDDPVCADVLVDGSVVGWPYRFVLDTGAARTHLVSDDLTVSLPVVRTVSSAGALAAGRDDIVTVSNLSLGPIRVQSLDVVRVPAEQPGSRSLIGMDVLRSFCCHVRLTAAELRLESSRTGEATQDLEMDARGHSYVTLWWPGIRARACWDTGAGITVVDQAFHAAHRELFAEAGTSYGTDSTGAHVETPMYVMRGPEIGGASFGRPPGGRCRPPPGQRDARSPDGRDRGLSDARAGRLVDGLPGADLGFHPYAMRGEEWSSCFD